ncbi:DUF3024 domain-containing protein [bacterium]|nr:MAG: DUF3024 domain-containing protein [bacterium]
MRDRYSGTSQCRLYYKALPPVRDIDKALEEVEKRPTRIFWGRCSLL